ARSRCESHHLAQWLDGRQRSIAERLAPGRHPEAAALLAGFVFACLRRRRRGQLRVRDRVEMTRARVGAVLLATGLIGSVHQPVRGSERGVTTLEIDRPVERPLARGDEHRYAIALQAHERAHLVVVQRDVDAVVDTFDTNGVAIAEYEDEIRR